jgi:hypothetical protein
MIELLMIPGVFAYVFLIIALSGPSKEEMRVVKNFKDACDQLEEQFRRAGRNVGD